MKSKHQKILEAVERARATYRRYTEGYGPRSRHFQERYSEEADYVVQFIPKEKRTDTLLSVL